MSLSCLTFEAATSEADISEVFILQHGLVLMHLYMYPARTVGLAIEAIEDPISGRRSM